MTRIAVVGGHGQVARHLHSALLRRGHTPVALVRKEEHRPELEGLGAEVRLLDIERQGAAEFAAAFEGCGVVVFAAGGGTDGDVERKRTVDLAGSVKSIAAARQAGISRFIQLSSMGVDDELPEDTDEVWKAYVAAKRDADEALRNSDLDWTILRPGRLTDGAATGRVALAPDLPRGEVTRADVAEVLAELIDAKNAVRAQWCLVAGSTTIEAAVAQSVRPE